MRTAKELQRYCYLAGLSMQYGGEYGLPEPLQSELFYLYIKYDDSLQQLMMHP